MRTTRCTIALAMVFSFAPTTFALGDTRNVSTVEQLLRGCTLIAHVRVAGELGSAEGDAGLVVVEVIDAACGAKAGQLCLFDRSTANDSHGKFRTGEQFLLLAKATADGWLEFYSDELGKVPVGEDGRLAEHKLLAGLLGSKTSTAEEAIVRLWNLCAQLNYQVAVDVVAKDLSHYKTGDPLPVKITVHNAGGYPLAIENRIEYERFMPYAKHLEELQKLASDALPVKLYVQQLDVRPGLEKLQTLRSLSRSRSFHLGPGEIGQAVFDLADESDVQSGGRWQIWATVGGRSSIPIEIQLPQRDEALKELAKAMELAEGEGPFHKVAQDQSIVQPMPMATSAEEMQILDLVLSQWLADNRPSHDDKPEAFLLRRRNLPRGYTLRSKRYQGIVCDAWRSRGESSESKLATTQGTFHFRQRAVQVDSISIDGRTATVAVSQSHHHFRSSTGGTYQLRRENGQWQIAAPTQRWIN